MGQSSTVHCWKGILKYSAKNNFPFVQFVAYFVQRSDNKMFKQDQKMHMSVSR